MNTEVKTETPDAKVIPEIQVTVDQEPEDPRSHATLVGDIERMRQQCFATGTLCGVDLNRLSPADLRALETQALAEKTITLAARAQDREREAALYAATHQDADQVQARANERVINFRARHRARANENDQRAHSLRHRAVTPEPPMAA